MERKNTKIILTGYRATGKTSLGRILADRLLFLFIDTDLEIEKQQGSSINEIVAKEGWNFFRTLERDYLSSLVKRENLVIAPGGGAIMHQEVWDELMKTSLVIWLQADIHTINKRLSADLLSASQRPALTQNSDMLKEIAIVLAEREPLYRKGSHHAISTERPIERIVEEILNLWATCNAKKLQPDK